MAAAQTGSNTISAHIYFRYRYNATSSDIVDNNIEQLDLKTRV